MMSLSRKKLIISFRTKLVIFSFNTLNCFVFLHLWTKFYRLMMWWKQKEVKKNKRFMRGCASRHDCSSNIAKYFLWAFHAEMPISPSSYYYIPFYRELFCKQTKKARIFKALSKIIKIITLSSAFDMNFIFTSFFYRKWSN